MEKIPNYTSLTHKRIIRVLFRSPAESFVGCIFNVPALYTYRLEPTASFQRVVPSEYPKYFLIKDFFSDLTLKKYHTDFFPSIGRFQSTRAWFLVSGSHFSNNISFSRFGLLKYLYTPEITITMANYAKQEKLRPENWHYTTLIKFAVVFDTFTEAWKSKVKLMKTAILYLLITIWISFPVKSEDKREHFRSICRFIHRLFHFKTDFLQFEASGEKNDKSGKKFKPFCHGIFQSVTNICSFSHNATYFIKFILFIRRSHNEFPIKKIKQLINILLSYWEWAIWGWKTFPSNPSSISCS